MLTFRFNGADGSMVEEETLTSGMVKKEVKLEFSHDWDNMTKTVVFSSGLVTRAVVGVSDVAVIPAEVLAKPSQIFWVGVYGVSRDGKVIPTIQVMGPSIKPGTDPSYDKGTNPELAIWAQLQQKIVELQEQFVGGAIGGYYVPEITQTNENTVYLSFCPSNNGMVEVERKKITLPGGNASSQNSFSEEQVRTLDDMFKVCAFIKDDVSVEYAAFQTAFGLTDSGGGGEEEPDEPVVPDVTLTRITAMYSGDDVEVGTALTDLTGITVTAYYSDGSTKKVTGYTLSGTIAEGENTITVTYEGMTATFTVAGVAEVGDPDILYALAAPMTFDGVDDVLNTGATPFAGDKNWTIVTRFTPEAFASNSQDMPSVFLVGEGENFLTIRLSKEIGAGMIFYVGKAKSVMLLSQLAYDTEYACAITHKAGSGLYDLVFTGGTYSLTAPDYVSTTELSIGCNTVNEGRGHFHGTISDFKVYSRVLTDAELTEYIG